MNEQGYKKALECDSKDPLKDFRDRFVLEDDVIYLDGNSLGRLPKRTNELIADLVSEGWGKRLIRSWNESWIELSARIAAKVAPIVGAGEDEIFIGDSTTINLFKLAFACLEAQKGKSRIISDEFNFPADIYILQGLIRHHFSGFSLELMRSNDGIMIEESQLSGLVDEHTALVVLSHVAFKSAFMYDMERVNRIAHDHNSLVIWDLSHAAGVVPVELGKSGADMAVGCTYKYLNGGPGSPAFLYIRKDLQAKMVNPITSWFSHERPFEFDLNYEAAGSIQKFATGTPSILSLAAIEPGLDITNEAGISRIREKSLGQTEYMADLIKERLIPLGFGLASPLDAGKRGSHLSISHPEAYRINRAMIEPADGSRVIIPDFRPPDNLRLGLAPLYTSYNDIFYTVKRIERIVETREYEQFGGGKLRVP